ncbi:hypothetical protein ACFOWM_03540 [Ferruginibacter yonginensis]|uniref:Uncharacterized protein n=1 Tax=Ferruginibacter yonginensis TaxID=1310416 RepID=A0ABV8QQC0_9BACT
MKPAYSNITIATGAHVPGICKIEVAPLHTLSSRIFTNFITGEINEPLVLTTSMIDIPLIPNSCKISSKSKSSRAGDYFEISIEGLLNELTTVQFRRLETLRYEKLITLVTLLNKSQLLIGSNSDGMRFSFNTDISTNQNQIAWELNYVSENAVAFYVP